MAPTLHRRTNPAQLKTWLIAVAVVASVIVTALIIYLVMFRLRNKQYQEAARRDPYLTRKEWARKRKLSNLERLEEEEVQRQLILRKTLTSRTSSRNDSIFESRRDTSSAEEPREDPAKSHEDEWKRWEAGYGAEAETDDCEGHPLIEQHPAIKIQDQDDQLPRSISPSRAPLLGTQEPESLMTSLWERRLSDRHNNARPMRESPNSPPRAPPSSSTAPESIIEPPHITVHPAHHPLHNSSPRHARSAGELQRQSPSHRSRAASTDAQRDPTLRSAAASLHSRASSNPVNHAPSQPPNSSRTRSNSEFTAPSPSLLSPPPPAALPHSASPRKDAFLSPGLEQPQLPTQRARSLSRVPAQTTQEQALHSRARSHEMLPFFRPSSPSPAQSPRRKPVPARALGGKVSTSSLASGTRAAGVSPTVSPVEEATLESERTPVSPGATLRSDDPPSFPTKDGLERMAASDRDVLPSRLQETLQLDPVPFTPRQNNSSSEDYSQPSSFEGGAFFDGPQAARKKLPAASKRGSSSPRHEGVPRLTTPEQPADHLDAGNGEAGTAFSFEIGDQLKELGISVRRLPQRSASPPGADSEPRQQSIELDSEDDEVSSTFSSEEEVYLKELGVPIQHRGTQRPGETHELSSYRQPTRHMDPREQGGEAAFSFEEDGELREMKVSHREPPQRQNPPLTQLEIPRLNKDRSRSFEDRNTSQPGAEAAPDVIAQRLRSRSFEPVAQGRWQLQVSVLDQTGARHPRTSREGESDDFYSSGSEPTSPEEAATFNADIPLAPLIVPSSRRAVAPEAARDRPMVHKRTPSTPLTSPDSDTSGLCRANFASPVREKQLAEEQFAARSPPAYRPVHLPPAVSPPMYNQPAFYAPHMQTRHAFVSPPMNSASTFGSHPMQSPQGFVSPQTEAGWTVASPGWRRVETMETDYGRDTMKETFGSGPQAAGPDGEKSKVSFRLSGPPDFMPAFF